MNGWWRSAAIVVLGSAVAVALALLLLFFTSPAGAWLGELTNTLNLQTFMRLWGSFAVATTLACAIADVREMRHIERAGVPAEIECLGGMQLLLVLLVGGLYAGLTMLLGSQPPMLRSWSALLAAYPVIPALARGLAWLLLALALALPLLLLVRRRTDAHYRRSPCS